MNFSDICMRAGRNLREAKARTVLTALAIAVGATTITLAMAAGNGGRAFTNDIVQSSGDAYSLNVYQRPQVQAPVQDGLPEYGVATKRAGEVKIERFSEREIAAIRALDSVEAVHPMLDVEVDYVTRGGTAKKYVAPVSVKLNRATLALAAGSLDDQLVRPGQVVIPVEHLASFGFRSAEQAIGQRLLVAVSKLDKNDEPLGPKREFTFSIAAVSKKGDTTMYYDEDLKISPEDSQAMYAFQRDDDMSRGYYGLSVLAKKDSDVAPLQQAIEQKGYQVNSAQAQGEQFAQMITIAQLGLIGFGALAVVASVFGIINTQYISVLERTQQIGLMKAMGASRRDIARLFRYEAAWVGLLGGVLGVLIGFAGTLFNPLISSMIGLQAETKLLQMDWVASAGLVLGLMAISIASGYFPSRKAAKLDPIEALRTE